LKYNILFITYVTSFPHNNVTLLSQVGITPEEIKEILIIQELLQLLKGKCSPSPSAVSVETVGCVDDGVATSNTSVCASATRVLSLLAARIWRGKG
jgi:hypothetical protein